jgi:small-conductance mechanosensitive channel
MMNLEEMFHELSQVITKQHIFNFIVACIMMLVGIFISKRVDRAVARLSQLDTSQRLLFNKIGKYGVLTLALAAALNQLGFDLRVLLGAAGVLTVAIGFAAQTSASNLISGLFLMIERPFTVGDVVSIPVGDISGEIMSIDLLSTKIRTFTNLMVRVPNETMVKNTITNYSYFPVRRLDFNIGVSYSADLAEVEEVLRGIAKQHPLCLTDPEPIFVAAGFGDSAVKIQFFVYTMSENLTILQNDLYHQIKIVFKNKQIEIPYPVQTVLTQSPNT